MTPRIYVASLSDYNNGHLLGEWIDLDDIADTDELHARIGEMLRKSKFPNVRVECAECNGNAPAMATPCEGCDGSGEVPSAEEWAIHDYDLSGIRIGEHPDLDAVLMHAKMLEEHGDAWVAYCAIANEPSGDDFSDRYYGEYDSEAAWAEAFMDDTGDLAGMPEHLRGYFDFEAYARDCRMGGDICFERVGGSIYVFSNN